MSITAVSYKLFSFGNRFVKSFGLVHGKYRGKLLMCEFFADVYRFNFTDQNLCLRRNCNTGHLSDSGSLLAYDLRNDDTLGSGAVGALGDDELTFLADNVLSAGKITFSFDEGLLAVHHTGAGHLAELHYISSFDFHNLVLSL